MGGGGGSGGVFGRYGIDPVSRAAGIEPASFGRAVGGIMGGGGGQNTNTIQNADPWSGQQPYLQELFREAQRQYQGAGPQYFPGSTTAARDPATLAAMEQMRGAAGTQGDAARLAMTGYQSQINAPDVANNPYAQGAIGAAISPAVRAFTDTGGVMSNIRGEFGSADQYGGTRHALALGLASDRLSQNILDTTARMSGDFYNQGLTAQGRALALGPQVQGMQAAPGTTLATVGAAEEAFQQQQIDEAIKKWQFEQNLPAAKLAQYQSNIQGGYGGTQSTMATAPRANPLLGAVGGAAAGYAMGGMVGGAANGAAYGPWGAAIGAVIGLLASR